MRTTFADKQNETPEQRATRAAREELERESKQAEMDAQQEVDLATAEPYVPGAQAAHGQMIETYDREIHGSAAVRAGRFVEQGDLPGMVSMDDAMRSLESVPTEGAGTAREWYGDILRVKGALAEMKKVIVFIPQRPPNKPPASPASVQINDYTLSIPRGKGVAVPLEVARILDDAGYFNAPE